MNTPSSLMGVMAGFVLAAVGSVNVCLGQEISAVRVNPHDPAKCDALPVSALDREAVDFLKRAHVSKYYVSHGESLVVRTNYYGNRVITELRGPIRFVSVPGRISAADELNAITWHGQIGIVPRATRAWQFDKAAPTETKADPWKGVNENLCAPLGGGWQYISLQKVGGKWQYDSPAVEEALRNMHMPRPDVDKASGAPFWTSRESAARPAWAQQLVGAWTGSDPSGPASYEITEVLKASKSGKLALGKCTGSLWFSGFDGSVAIFKEEFPAFSNCPGSVVKVTLKAADEVAYERMDADNQLLSSGSLFRSGSGHGSVARSTVSQVASPASASAGTNQDILGAWKINSTAKENSGNFEFKELKTGDRSVASVHYGLTGCTNDLELQGYQYPIYEFRERPRKLLVCGTGALFRIEVKSANSARVEQIRPSTGDVVNRFNLVR